ncbi:hypothetical protein [Candidatus Tisiphia endosymbiont of Hybos culiciformis]|uniref:hypothetical protein n=1 Tax=Candidatus Tisiphia endosymbiont of Hybos culiciformis TaxID=3139331 RepID=UPI003CCAB02E
MHFHVNFIDSSALMNSVANPMSFPRRRESSVGCHSHKSRNLYPCLRRDDTEEKMSFPRRRESSVGCHSHKSRNLYPCLRRDDTEEKMSFPRRRESSVGCHSHESRNLEPCLHRDDTEEKMSFPRRRESSVGCHSHESRNLEPCLHRDDTKLSKDNTDILDLMGRSICHYMLDSFLIFMPNEDDYLRLDKNFMAPTNVSFGNNNRTVAVRIPDSSPRRVEHRIASPLTDPYLAIFTILNSILLGLEFPDKINNINKIYGNAFDQQYNLVPLPKSLAEALELFNLQFFLTNLDISI